MTLARTIRFPALAIGLTLLWAASSSEAADTAGAPSCDSFSLTSPGGSMEHVPVLDQGDVNDCYAYSTSEATDAWRFSNHPEDGYDFHTSPQATAVMSKAMDSKSVREKNSTNLPRNGSGTALDEGRNAEPLRVLKKTGICSYEALGENFKESLYGDDQSMFWKQLQQMYAIYHRRYLKALVDHDQAAQDEILAQANANLTMASCNAGIPGDRAIESLTETMGIVSADSVFEAMRQFTAKTCAEHTKALPADFPLPASFSLNQIDEASAKAIKPRTEIYRGVLQSMFAFKNKQPVVIGMCDQALTKPSFKGLDDENGFISNACGMHSLLIVGRGKMSNGECGYLLRNSWGTDVDDTHGLESTQGETGSDVWVSESTLFRNLIDMTVLPPKGEPYAPPTPPSDGFDPSAIATPKPRPKQGN